ncbi:DUF6531 domain-containing protein [Streptomyces sp. DH37]|uniref:DUF6531 domain-containing protein n=1 Tax=Streptomyces sp. DH37 TaxID=3040122 RepID=UPI0024411E38|nr:DUF6531 domain-containing protein [Streptomyces sp. DH37]MDG9704423.1 RHS repeat-associated core domain-containing protein [Streptomyces sp. DH37]
MGYVLPEGADAMLDIIGVGWPNVDEDDYRDMATELRSFADDVDDDAQTAHKGVERLLANGQSEALDALSGYWDKVKGKHLKDLAEAARVFAGALDAAADLIAGRKAVAVGELIALAASIGIGLAAAPFTAGLSTLLSAGAIQACRIAVKRALKEAADLAVEEIVAAMSEPAVAALEGMAAELVVQLAANGLGVQDGVDMGAVGDAGEEGLKEGLNLASADGPGPGLPNLGGLIGTLDIDDDEHDRAATRLNGVSLSMKGRTSGKLGNARGHQGRTRGKDELADLVNEVADRGMNALEKATRQLGDHLGGALPKGVRNISASHQANDRRTKDSFDGIRTPDGPDGRRGGGPGGGGPPTGGAPSAPHLKPDSLRTVKSDPRTNGIPLEKKTRLNDPVDVATGEMTLAQTDLELPGVLPLVLRRVHLSNYRWGQWFGRSWASTLDERLHVDGDGTVVWAREDGSLLTYPRVPEAGGEPEWPVEGPRLPLVRAVDEPGFSFSVTDPRTGWTRCFAEAELPGSVFDAPALCHLAAVEDRNGNRVEIVRGSGGAPEAVVHSGGYQVSVTSTRLDGDGPVRVTGLALRTPDGPVTVVSYGHDAAGNLDAVVDSSGQALRFAYDDAARITSWTDRNDSAFRYVYDDAGRVVRTIGPDGFLSSTFEYTADEAGNRVTRYTDSTGATTVLRTNGLRQVVARTDAHGHTTHQTWDGRDNLLSLTDPLGRTTSWTYDEAGNLTGITLPDGGTAAAVYNGLNLPVEITGPDGSVWRQTYDGHGNRTSITAPDGGTTAYTHDAHGAVAAVTNPAGAVQRLANDAAGLPLEVTDPDGHTSVIERDAFGRPATVTDPLGAVTRLEWTVEGRPARRVLPDGSTESWAWDGEGNCTSHTDPNGGTTRFEYTHFDRLAARTGPDGVRYAFAYDTELRLTQVTGPQGLTWDYAYDRLGRLLSETDFDGRTVAYGHDAAGRLTSRTTPAGHEIRYEHDVLNRMTAKDADGLRTEYAYDAAGRPVRAASPDSVLTVERDVLGRVLAETVDGRTTRYTYDVLGRRTSRTTPSGAVTELTYDAAGNRTSLTASGHTLAFTHDALGHELERSFGAADRPVTLATVFDALGRPTEQTLAAAGRTLRSRGYAYRPDGHLTSVTDQLTGATRHFGLDPVGRPLTVTAEDWSETYAYDAAGNQTSAHWPDTAPHTEARGERIYDGTRLTRAGRVRYAYDAAGRTVLRRRTRLSKKPETWRYEWDAEDRLVSCTTPDGTRWRYRYDPLGRRTAKQRLTPGGEVAEEILFTWDGTRLAEETNRATHTVLTWDHDGHRPLAQTERLLDPDDRAEVDRRFFAIVTDLVGTPTELVDETGAIAWHTRTTLWGTTTWNRDATAYTPLRFPGQYADPETGLHYNHFRHYDPDTGRYATPDPLGLAPAPNPVAYVHNPHTWTDPLGLAPECGGEGAVTVYRKQTDHPLSRRVHIGKNGEVTITGHGKLYVNMSGDIKHTTEFRGDGGQIVAFDVPREYRDAIRAAALPQNKDDHPDGSAFTRQEWKQLLKEYPEISDPTKGPDLYGIPDKLLDQFRGAVIPGSGRVIQEG